MKHHSFPAMCRIYQMLLLFYPANHRRDYSALMVQLFRDRCRDAYETSGSMGLVVLWPQILVDLVFTATQERITILTNGMKNVNKLSYILFAATIVFVLSFTSIRSFRAHKAKAVALERHAVEKARALSARK